MKTLLLDISLCFIVNILLLSKACILDKCLAKFTIGIRFQTLKKAWNYNKVNKNLDTFFTFWGFPWTVNSQMFSNVWTMAKSFATFFPLVLSLISMNFQVLSKVWTTVEICHIVFTLVWFLSAIIHLVWTKG